MTQNSFLYLQQNNGLDNFACQRQINFLELKHRKLHIKNTVSFPQPEQFKCPTEFRFLEKLLTKVTVVFVFLLSYNKETLSILWGIKAYSVLISRLNVFFDTLLFNNSILKATMTKTP